MNRHPWSHDEYARLSETYLPQRTLGLNHRDYPAGSAAGYVRIKEKGKDPLESITLEKVEGGLQEVSLRNDAPAWQTWIMKNMPGFCIVLAKWLRPAGAVKRYPALQISRNYLSGLNAKIVGTTFTTPRSHMIAIPYGSKVVVAFHAPHCFANIQYYEPFLEAFRQSLESPETIPNEVIAMSYIPLPIQTPEPIPAKKTPLFVKDYASVAHLPFFKALANAAKRLTPNQISIAGFGAGILGAGCFLAHLYAPASAFFFVHLLCDGLDGYVARLTGKSSFSGFLLDHVLDRLSDVIIFTCIGFALGLEREGFALVVACLLSSYLGLLPKLAGVEQNKSGVFAKTYRYQFLIICTLASALVTGSATVLFHAYFILMLGLGIVTLFTRGQSVLQVARSKN